MFTDDELRTIIQDIATAESFPLPGPAKQGWVIAQQINRRCTSPPPVWIWLIAKAMEAIIPALLDWLKTKYGDNWLTKITDSLGAKKLPWL
jgi:hypothetical protein